MKKGLVVLASALDRLGVLGAALAMRRYGLWPGSGLTVLCYHRVTDPSAIGDLDPELVDAEPADFDAQMGYLRRHMHPVSLEQVLAAHRGGAPLPPGSVLVTFDDGYRDNFDTALPILQRHGIKAVFFISTGHVGQRRLFWWERINLILGRADRAAARLEYPAAEELDLSAPAAKRRALRRCNRIVKDHVGLELERFLDGLATACGVSWTEAEDRRRADETLMTWDHVRALRAAGMGIGSHTRGHRVLQTLPAAELAAELRESRATLERELGEPVTTIAYPVGKPIADFPAVRQALADAGYELGFTTTPGMNPLAPAVSRNGGPQIDRFDLRRLLVDRGVPTGLARVYFAVPSLAR